MTLEHVDRIRLRERLAAVINDDRAIITRGELLSLVSDLEWTLDEIERLRDLLDRTETRARKAS
jgi:hypothetical protein